MPVTGLRDARRFHSHLTTEVSKDLAERAVARAARVGAAYSDLLTPVDTSFLINSRFIRIDRIPGGGFKAMIGYTAKYAAAVHEMKGTMKGLPRKNFGTTKAGQAFGGGTGVGNYWDPNAEPQFLRKGFENNFQEIDKIVRDTFKK